MTTPVALGAAVSSQVMSAITLAASSNKECVTASLSTKQRYNRLLVDCSVPRHWKVLESNDSVQGQMATTASPFSPTLPNCDVPYLIIIPTSASLSSCTLTRDKDCCNEQRDYELRKPKRDKVRCWQRRKKESRPSG